MPYTSFIRSISASSSLSPVIVEKRRRGSGAPDACLRTWSMTCGRPADPTEAPTRARAPEKSDPACASYRMRLRLSHPPRTQKEKTSITSGVKTMTTTSSSVVLPRMGPSIHAASGSKNGSISSSVVNA